MVLVEKITNWFCAMARAFTAKKCIKRIFPVKFEVKVNSDGSLNTVIPCLFVNSSNYGFSSLIRVCDTGDVTMIMKYNGNEHLQHYAYTIQPAVTKPAFVPNKFSPMDISFLSRVKLEAFLNKYRDSFKYLNIRVEDKNLVISAQSNTWSDSYEESKRANNPSLIKHNSPKDVENFIMGVAMEMVGPHMKDLLKHLFDVIIA